MTEKWRKSLVFRVWSQKDNKKSRHNNYKKLWDKHVFLSCFFVVSKVLSRSRWENKRFEIYRHFQKTWIFFKFKVSFAEKHFAKLADCNWNLVPEKRTHCHACLNWSQVCADETTDLVFGKKFFQVDNIGGLVISFLQKRDGKTIGSLPDFSMC